MRGARRRVHLHRYADDVVARFDEQTRSNGRIDAAAHRGNHTFFDHLRSDRITLGWGQLKAPMRWRNLGERFRAAREARGLSLSDVAEQIRIRSVYLAAIEDENWNAIGAPGLHPRLFAHVRALSRHGSRGSSSPQFNAGHAQAAVAGRLRAAPTPP